MSLLGAHGAMLALGSDGGESFYDTVMGYNPWGYWRLSDAAGAAVAADASGNARNGSYASQGVTSYGQSGLFGGTGQSIAWATSGHSGIQLPNFTANATIDTTVFSILCNIRTSTARYAQIVSSDNGSLRRWQWRVNNTSIEVITFSPNTQTLTVPVAVNDGQPHMVALVWDETLADAAGKIKVYVDGALAGQTTATRRIAAGGSTAMAIGVRGAGTTSEAMIGTVDDTAIWVGQALTSGQIAELWAARNT